VILDPFFLFAITICISGSLFYVFPIDTIVHQGCEPATCLLNLQNFRMLSCELSSTMLNYFRLLDFSS